MKSSTHDFGFTEAGEKVLAFLLENEAGAKVRILNYGGILQAICVPDRNGAQRDVCLGYASVKDYERNDCYLGALIGRCANRIANARFDLNGKRYQLAANNGKNHLHGGKRGFDRRIWQHNLVENGLELFLSSPDGEENYPGNLAVKVSYALDENNALSIVYEARADQDTIVNLTNHAYFNLNGESGAPPLDHELTLYADAMTLTDDDAIPTGQLLPVQDTPFDFRTPKPIGRDIDAAHPQLRSAKGYDHNFVLGAHDGTLRQAARVRAPESGITMEVFTTMPGVQFYTANYLHSAHGKSGAPYAPRMAFCLETQHFPNAVHCPAFPTPILRKGEMHRERTQYRFFVTL